MRLGLGLGLTRAGATGPDPNLAFTKLLMGAPGADGSQVFGDESPANQPGVSFQGDPQVDTSLFKFGTGSYQFDGITDKIFYPDSDDWHFGTGAFSVEFWIRPTGSGVEWVLGHGTNLSPTATNSWALWMNNRIPRFSFVEEGSSAYNATSLIATTTLSTTAFTHVAVDRTAGGVGRIYINGVVEDTETMTQNIKSVNNFLIMGCEPASGNTFVGHLDEIRILKGAAAWGGAFTPPTAAYART